MAKRRWFTGTRERTPIPGLQAMCIGVIEDARKNIKCDRPMYDGVQEPWVDALWLLCDARDTLMPVAYKGRHQQFYRRIRSEVFKSKGFRQLMRIIADPLNGYGQILAKELDKFEIWS